MASTLPAFQSGGAPLVSGDVYSGNMTPLGGVRLFNSPVSSGSVFVGVAVGLTSGGLTLASGGDLSSGGMSDGMEVPPNSRYEIPRLVCSGQVEIIRVIVPPGVSGRCRVFWDAF